MVGGSSMLGLSAVAVEREMVGNERDAELMGGAAVFPPVVCRAAWAGVSSAFDLGDVEKNWVKRFGLEDALMAIPPFPETEEKDGEVEGSLVEELADRRGIARKPAEQGKRIKVARHRRDRQSEASGYSEGQE